MSCPRCDKPVGAHGYAALPCGHRIHLSCIKCPVKHTAEPPADTKSASLQSASTPGWLLIPDGALSKHTVDIAARMVGQGHQHPAKYITYAQLVKQGVGT
jgi:hypothetical protein